VRPNRGFMSQLHEYHSRSSNSLQANVVDEPAATVTDEKREQEGRKGGKPRRRSDSARSPRKAAKGSVYSSLAALTLSPTTFPQERFGGHEYWKLERRIS